MIKLWLLSVVVGTVGASMVGLNAFHPYLYEAIIHISLALMALLLMLVFRWAGAHLLCLMVTGLLPMGMIYSEVILNRDINPGNELVTVSKDVPVSLSTWISNGAIRGRITNRHPRNWLRLARVHCTPAFANGDLSQHTQEIGVAAGGWLAPGEHTESLLVDSKGLQWSPGMVLYLTSCRVASADFYVAPAVTPQFAMTRDERLNHYVFDVHNQHTKSLSRVSFSCWVLNDAQGSTPHKQDITVRPLYGDDAFYIAKPGENVVLYSTESFAGRRLSDCAARDVTWK